MDALLKTLRLEKINPGTCSGHAKWFAHSKTLLLDSINPATEKIIAQVQTGDHSDYENIVQQAQSAFLCWREMPAPKRGEIIRQLGEKLRQHKQALGQLVSLEMGKSLQEGLGEVQEMIDMADFAVGQSRMLYGKTMHSERLHHRMYEQWHPLGVVGIITAFNFPVAVWAWNAFIAAIAGNVCIWKPSPKTPLCAIAIQHLCNDVMQENQLSAIFNLWIPENDTLAETFVADERIPLISFTGSSHVGKKIATQVAARLGKTLLELSGNNAIILDPSANLDLAIPAIVFGAVGTAGQRCTTTRRLIIHEKIKAEVIARLVHAYQQITIGNPLDSKNLMGPLIDKKAVSHYQETIEKIKQNGGEILFGGKALHQPGFYVEPTLAAISSDAEIIQHETFAPILYLLSYREIDEAIALQNQVKQGLSSAIFTENLTIAERFLSSNGSDCGIANVNIGTSGAEIGGAFGGEKETGGGREAGSDAWKAYMRRQTCTINWSHALPLAQGIQFHLPSSK